jgi:ATP-dependent helicase HrpB
MHPSGLPIDAILPQLRRAFTEHRSVVLHAPPGAGKSTVVPLALLDEPWEAGRKILMLEPRRLAARAVARRMAATLGEDVGQTVGYRMRLDTRVSRATRIEVVTEGVLTRMLQQDPALEQVALVIFDEFHERSLQADLGLALTLDARDALAPALRVLVMSATLEVKPIARLLGDAVVIRAEGRVFPVEHRFVGRGAPLLPAAGRPRGESAERLVAGIVRRALDSSEGDVLVFLPGAAEIGRTAALLEDPPLPAGVRIHALYGDLDAATQDAAIAQAPPGARKIVLATNIAETSLTIEGVRVVVDSGLVRRSAFDPASGMSRLETRRISRAAAEQRQGRAGRVAPGVCYRAWSESAHAGLPAVTPPEIVAADLAPLALELASWGIADPGALRWLDPPPEAMLASARDLLRRLGAIDAAHRITAHGRAIAELPLHPRLAHMLLEARRLGLSTLGARLAALLAERDPLRGADADIRTRLSALERGSAATRSDGGVLRRIRQLADQFARAVGSEPQRGVQDDSAAGLLLAFAYPDRIGRRRPGDTGTFTLTGGRGAHFAQGEALAREPFIVAVELDDRDRDALIRLAAPITKEDIEQQFAQRFERAETVEWNRREQAVLARATVRLDAILIEDKPLPEVPRDQAVAAMLDGIAQLGVDQLPWNDATRNFQSRIEFARALDPEAGWPAADDTALAITAADWLAPWLAGITRREHLAGVPLADALRALLTREQQLRLDRLAPTHLVVPSGSRIPIEYRGDHAPSVAVRLQEVFGLAETPRIGDGRVPLTFALLSPARRPVQVTRDLASFWRSAYHDVRRDLRGRYPKHHWPEDPLHAAPARGPRRTRR